ncbi:hypothetical protein NUU61_009937 [Penicillium alfredii]|uniref:Zn(2)-C6 fungal-type domain-containing protein n=1 Tax=Penicillium alfredii TaxID=1506179 RepID=A0A9W9JU01_9EURO|nr:uncharacterized protein NUU61_009937 [Penicillium alfredii]KAJ5081673.1 hypothetical protein NUU61_009937 [Penicillium alfredii]
MDETPDQYDASFLESLSDPDSFRVLDSELDESSQPVDLPEDCLFNGPARNHVDRSIEIPFRRLQPEPNHKVAIPRASTTRSRSNRARVLQACKSCQELKTKCSGHRPICHRCEELGLDCNYGERKREITAKSPIIRKIEDLSSQVHILGSLLCEIYPRLDTESAKRVSQSLNKVGIVSCLISTLPETCI